MPRFRPVIASAKYGSRQTTISVSVGMKGHALREQNLVPGARIAPRVYTLSACPWRRDELAVCEFKGLDSGVV